MRTSIDPVGRIVVPKSLRDAVGMTAGPVDVHVEGTRIVIEPIADDSLVDKGNLRVIPAAGSVITDDMVRDLLEEGRPR